MTLYLRHWEVKGTTRRFPAHVFGLFPDPNGGVCVTKFPHSPGNECEKQLDFIVRWAQQMNITIGNPEAWSLGKSV